MAIDDLIDSAPSTLGFLLTSGACFLCPAAIPLAAMQGTVISDPAQVWHVGDRHNALADHATATKADITQAVDKHADADKWSGEDKNAFTEAHVTPYQRALDDTAKMNHGIGGSMGTAAKVLLGIGAFSLTIGTIMAACAAAVAGVSWIPGVNVAAEGAATATAETSSGVFRSLLLKLGALLLRAGKLLQTIKGVLPALKFSAALGVVSGAGEFAGKTGLEGNKFSTAYWPGVSQAGALPGT
jgi:hypothetical protein